MENHEAKVEQPMFIVVEGLDGSGKSTLARELAAGLGAEHLTTPLSSLPSSARRAVETMCEGEPTARMLFYASTVVAASAHVRRLLASGRSVVMDRYWLSTLTYHRALGATSDLTDIESTLTPADLTVFLDVSREVRRTRLDERGELQAHDRMTLQEDTGEKIAALYRSLGGRLAVAGRFAVVEADRASVKELVDVVTSMMRGARG